MDCSSGEDLPLPSPVPLRLLDGDIDHGGPKFRHPSDDGAMPLDKIYIGHWFTVLKHDKRAIITAAGQAVAAG